MSGGHILIVDDDTANIRALSSVLGDMHEIRFATSGARALELAAAEPPELVLLDVLMPDLDGYEVCRRLKAQPATADVPIIFITSLARPEEEAFGLETGAVDYVTKPFSPAIVRARVATHLSLRRANRYLKDQNQHLEDLVTERTRKLALAQREKMAAVRQLVVGVAHEINTPVGVALSSASHLADRIADLSRQAAANQLRRSGFEQFLSSASKLADLLSTNIGRASEVVQHFKEVAADLRGVRRTFELKPFLEETAANLRPLWEPPGHRVAVTCPDGLRMESYPAVLSVVLEQLVRNAIEHAYAPGETGQLAIGAAPAGPDVLVLTVTDDGCGIRPDIADHILEPFFTTRRNAGSIGLGLNIVYNLMTDRLGGTVALASAGGTGERKGTRVTLSIPPCTPVDL